MDGPMTGLVTDLPETTLETKLPAGVTAHIGPSNVEHPTGEMFLWSPSRNCHASAGDGAPDTVDAALRNMGYPAFRSSDHNPDLRMGAKTPLKPLIADRELRLKCLELASKLAGAPGEMMKIAEEFRAYVTMGEFQECREAQMAAWRAVLAPTTYKMAADDGVGELRERISFEAV